MKKRQIKTIVALHYKAIHQELRRVLAEFNAGDILEFRLEVKRLRAFFHLLDMEAGGDTRFKIYPAIKVFYGYTGILRNIDMLLQMIASHFNADKDAIVFMDRLESELNYWKKIINDHARVNDLEMPPEILSRLPEKLRRRSVRKFAGYLCYEVDTFSTRCEDDKLNNTRKLLEDILFNWQYLQPYLSALPERFRNKSILESVVNSLIEFRDTCASQTILEKYNNESEDETEKAFLTRAAEFCRMQKDTLKDAICSGLLTGHEEDMSREILF